MRYANRSSGLGYVFAIGCVALGCAPIGGGGSPDDTPGNGDCRLAAFACAPGFVCGPSGDDWSCRAAQDGALHALDAGPDFGELEHDASSPEPEPAPDAARPDPEAPDVGEPEPVRSGPGGPCQTDGDCRLGRCIADPGGRCVIGCASDDDCGEDAACVTEVDGEPTCVERCEGGPCRPGWICADIDDRLVCLPDCALAGCRPGLDCRIDGACAPPMCAPVAERCDGADDDCDGRADEDAPCPAGSRCDGGRCRDLAGPAEACREDSDCQNDTCMPPEDIPGGFCFEDCLDDADCGPDAICALEAGGASICGQPCDATPCRPGWVCADWQRPFVCVPGCASVGCEAGLVCGDDGFCDWPRATVIVEQVFISPAKPNGMPWDGPNGAVGAGALDAVGAALGAADPITALLRVFGQDILDAYDAPDPAGTATLFVDGEPLDIALGEFPDSFTPTWPDVIWRDVPMAADVDLRLRIELTDRDLFNDDAIGAVSVNGADLRAALDAQQVWPVRVDDQGPPILLLAVSVIAQR